jgi:hypothetical protein
MEEYEYLFFFFSFFRFFNQFPQFEYWLLFTVDIGTNKYCTSSNDFPINLFCLVLSKNFGDNYLVEAKKPA